MAEWNCLLSLAFDDSVIQKESELRYLVRWRDFAFTVACVANVSVRFGSKELQGDKWSD